MEAMIRIHCKGFCAQRKYHNEDEIRIQRDCRSRVSSLKQLHEGDSAHHVFCWSHVQTRGWRWFVQLDHFCILHRSLDGQVQLLKGVEENKFGQQIIWLLFW